MLKNLDLVQTKNVSVFEEAIQTVANFIEAPITTLSLIVENEIWIKSAVGLEILETQKHLPSSLKFPCQQAFCTYVVNHQENLIINDAIADTFFEDHTLVKDYGIRAYLGIPLITITGMCIGALEVMDVQPRQFSDKEVNFLAITARWCMREYEINYLNQHQENSLLNTTNNVLKENENNRYFPELLLNLDHSQDKIKIRLIKELTENICVPLTSVIGMTSILQREIYGNLTNKQKEYLEIIHSSGQKIRSLLQEMMKLSVINENNYQIQLKLINLKTLCEEIINNLKELGKQKQQTFYLFIEPNSQNWSIDREKIQQSIYYLINSLIEVSQVGAQICIHISHDDETINIAVWLIHQWLGDSLPQIALKSSKITNIFLDSNKNPSLSTHWVRSSELIIAIKEIEKNPNNSLSHQDYRDLIQLLFSCYLAELHDSKIILQGSSNSGYRYILKIPKIDGQNSHNS